MKKIIPSTYLRPTRLVFFAAILIHAVTTSSVIAGEYVLVKSGTWTGEFVLRGTQRLCKAYEDNLRKFQREAYGMACARKLDPNLGFTRPKWNKLDPSKHINLVKDIHRFKRWKNIPTDVEIAERASEGRLIMELATIDLDQDGVLDNLIRIGNGTPCDPEETITNIASSGHKTLIRANKELSKVDIKTRGITGIDDVFLYKGKYYTDDAHVGSSGIPTRLPKEGRPVATLTLQRISEFGTTPICRYTYFTTD